MYTIFGSKIWKRFYREITYWNCVCDINPHKEAYDLSPRAKNRSYSMFSHFAAGEKSTKIKRICVSCYNMMGETAAGHMTHVCVLWRNLVKGDSTIFLFCSIFVTSHFYFCFTMTCSFCGGKYIIFYVKFISNGYENDHWIPFSIFYEVYCIKSL